MGKILLRILLVIVGIVVLLVIIGFLLPGKYSVARSATIKAPPATVMATVADFQTWPSWAAWWEDDPSITQEFTGTQGTVGGKVSWTSKSGPGAMTIKGIDPGKRVDIELALIFDDHTHYSANAFVLEEPTPGETKITWTMDGEMPANPVFRWMNLFMDGIMGKQFDRGFAKLKTKLEKPAEKTQ